jgi:galactokinase
MAGAASSVADAFQARFGKEPRVYRAPGRVNLIGEHTDYSLGFVLPIAIDFACWAAAAPNDDGKLRVYSLNVDEMREWPVGAVRTLAPAHDWSDYVIGVARQISDLKPLDVLIHSTVPVGAGLSSSAALEVSTALALGSEARGVELAKLARRAENDFVGVPCGIMDQYTSVFGREGAAIRIDCRSLEYETVELPDEVAIVAVNSMVKHELGASAYRERVRECAEAVEAIRAGGHPEVMTLRDAMVEELNLITDAVVRKRARHVITENGRVEQFVAAARGRDLARMGRLFVESHRSLQHDYEVSCEELDFLVDDALQIPGVVGARMTGGGFGGCTVNMVTHAAVPVFEQEIQSRYFSRFGIHPEIYKVKPSQGAGPVQDS